MQINEEIFRTRRLPHCPLGLLKVTGVLFWICYIKEDDTTTLSNPHRVEKKPSVGVEKLQFCGWNIKPLLYVALDYERTITCDVDFMTAK